MSLRYEWILSLTLRPDTPESSWPSCATTFATPPDRPLSARSTATIRPSLDNDEALPGGAVLSLRSLGLFIRTLILDDNMYDLVQTVPGWLARWSATEGWIGYAREESSREPWMYFYAQNRAAHLGGPGETPVVMEGAGP